MGKTRFQYQLSKGTERVSVLEKKSRFTYSDKEKRRQVDIYLAAKEKDKNLTLTSFASRIKVPTTTFLGWTRR